MRGSQLSLRTTSCKMTNRKKTAARGFSERRLLADAGIGLSFEQLREGDVVIVWKLDRLSRSLKDLLTILERIETAGAHFYSLTENIDSGSAAGRMMMQIVGSFAEFEREMFRERMLAGLASAKKQGRVGGRRPKLTTQQQKEVTRWVQSGEKSAADVARLFQVHPSTICRLMAKQGLVKVAEV